MTFPADGVAYWLVSRPYSVVLSPDQSDGRMFHRALLSCREKFVAGLASDKEGQCKHRHDFASVRPLTF